MVGRRLHFVNGVSTTAGPVRPRVRQVATVAVRVESVPSKQPETTICRPALAGVPRPRHGDGALLLQWACAQVTTIIIYTRTHCWHTRLLLRAGYVLCTSVVAPLVP